MNATLSSSTDISIYKGDVYSSTDFIPKRVASKEESSLTRSPQDDPVSKVSIVEETGLLLKKKTKAFISALVYITALGLGMNSALVGVTLVHMGCIYNLDTQGMSFTFVGLNIGYLVGSLAAGILFDKFNELYQCFLSSVLIGILITVAPWMGNIFGYITLVGITNCVQGFIFSSMHVYNVRLWPSHKRPAYQSVSAMRPVGSFILPFIAIPFLVEVHDSVATSVEIGNQTYSTNISTINNETIAVRQDILSRYENDSLIMENVTDKSNLCGSIDGLGDVRYLFLVVGMCLVAIGFGYLIFIGILRPPIRRKNTILSNTSTKVENSGINVNHNKTDDHDYDKKTMSNSSVHVKDNIKKLSSLVKGIIVSVSLTYILIFSWFEYIFANFLPTFTIKGLGLSVEKAALLLSVFYGLYMVGRVLCIFISFAMSPSTVLIVNSFFIILGYVMTLFCRQHEFMLWIAVPVLGFFLSSTFPQMVLWLSDYIVLTGSTNAVFFLCASLSSMSGGVIVGYLFQKYTYMSLVYFGLSSCLLATLLFIVMSILAVVYRKIEKR